MSGILKSIDPVNFQQGLELLRLKLPRANPNPFIIQVGKNGPGAFEPYVQKHRVLFDASGGRGVETQVWPKSDGLNCGYAGGLNPTNLRENIFRIFDAAEDQEVWIDVESGVRDGHDCLDLGKVAAFLDITKAYTVDR